MKVLIVFYSTYGHVYKMAQAVAEGVKTVAGAEVEIRRVPETLPREVLEKMGAVDAQKAFSQTPPGNCGPMVPWWAKSAAFLRAPPPSTAGRNRPFLRFMSHCFITVLWSSVCPIPFKVKCELMKLPAGPHTGHRPLPEVTAPECPARTNWKRHAFRVNTWPALHPNW